MDDGDWQADATIAVLAHSMLTSMTIIVASVKTLEVRWDRLDPEDRVEMLQATLEQAVHVSAILSDLVRGLPPDAIEVLGRRAEHLEGDAG